MSSGILHVKDSRTSNSYEIPIVDNIIRAANFGNIKVAKNGSDPLDKSEVGLTLLDPGYANTAVVDFNVSSVDGETGQLVYRGHDLKELYGKCEYEDYAHLLIWGRFPSSKGKEKFRLDLAMAAQDVPFAVKNVIQSFPQTAPAMTMIMAALSAYLGSNPCMLPAFEGGNLYQGNMELVDKAIIRTLSAYAIILALVHCHRSNNEFTPVKLDGSYLPNLLLMMGFVDTGTGEPDPKYTSVMRKKWVISADHGMTNSTSAFLHTASTQADPISCLVSALSSSYGPLHFGATEISYRTLQQVARPENVPALIARAKAGELRLPGVGHRMYKLVDPRLKPVLELLQELKEIQGKEDPLIATAREIHRLVAVDEYFTKRRLFVNADLYWVFIYTAMGFPADIGLGFVMAARLPGFLGHWRELMALPPKLWRPAQTYTDTAVSRRASKSKL